MAAKKRLLKLFFEKSHGVNITILKQQNYSICNIANRNRTAVPECCKRETHNLQRYNHRHINFYLTIS